MSGDPCGGPLLVAKKRTAAEREKERRDPPKRKAVRLARPKGSRRRECLPKLNWSSRDSLELSPNRAEG